MTQHQAHKNVTRQALKLGFVPLTDCAPLAVAKELGFFHRYGLKVMLSRELGWAAVRDKIITGQLHAAQAVSGMPHAATLGLGSKACDCVTGLVLNLHGNAITLSHELFQRGVRDLASLRSFINGIRGERILNFGVVFLHGSHNFLLRQWLRSGGIDPDNDVRIAVVPPPLMPATVKAGHIDGFCAGEPWNTEAIRQSIGWCASVTAEVCPGHPEKVLMVRQDFAQECAAEHEAMIAALLEALEFCSMPENQAEVLELLSRREYLNCSVSNLRPGLTGRFDFGHGQVLNVKDFVLFYGEESNRPSTVKAEWVVRQLKEAGLIDKPAALAALGGGCVFRNDIFERAVALRASSKPITNEKRNKTLALV